MLGGALGEVCQEVVSTTDIPAELVPEVHTDDTGWRVGGAPAYLMAFVHQSLSVYQIPPRHRNEEVRELIPADFQGVTICDRGPSYDARQLEEVAQQKCLSHLIRNAKAVEETKTGRARQFSRRLKELLQQALALSATRDETEVAEYTQRVEETQRRSDDPPAKPNSPR